MGLMQTDRGHYLDSAEEVAACMRCVLPDCLEKHKRCYLTTMKRSFKESRNMHIPINMTVPEILRYVKPLTPLEERLCQELEKLYDKLTELQSARSTHKGVQDECE